jgi:pimeloyl-ACP methyl ester carboxylesterase
LNPTEEALHPEILAMIKSMEDFIPAAVRKTPEGKRLLKVWQMMFNEPHIELKALATITAPTLVLASDHDIIRDEHTLEIYHNISNSQLCIFPSATHMVPYDDPNVFNDAVDRFFRERFVKNDRVKHFRKIVRAVVRLHTMRDAPKGRQPKTNREKSRV